MLEPGEEVQTSAPADSGQTYEPFQYRTLLAGVGGAWRPLPRASRPERSRGAPLGHLLPEWPCTGCERSYLTRHAKLRSQ